MDFWKSSTQHFSSKTHTPPHFIATWKLMRNILQCSSSESLPLTNENSVVELQDTCHAVRILRKKKLLKLPYNLTYDGISNWSPFKPKFQNFADAYNWSGLKKIVWIVCVGLLTSRLSWLSRMNLEHSEVWCWGSRSVLALRNCPQLHRSDFLKLLKSTIKVGPCDGVCF